MKSYAYRATAAGIARRQQERGQPIAAIEAVEAERALVSLPVASNVVRFRKRPREYEPTRIPSTGEVSRSRHSAFLAGLNTKPNRPEDIIRRVAAWHDLSYRDIMSNARFRHFVVARTDCIAAVRLAYPHDTLQGLATIFDRDHTAVLAALRKRGLK